MRSHDLPGLPPARISGQPETPRARRGGGSAGRRTWLRRSPTFSNPRLGVTHPARKARLRLSTAPDRPPTGEHRLMLPCYPPACAFPAAAGRSLRSGPRAPAGPLPYRPGAGAPPALGSCGVTGGARGPRAARKGRRCREHMGRGAGAFRAAGAERPGAGPEGGCTPRSGRD